MSEVTETVLFEGPGVLEKLTGDTPYKRLMGRVIFMEHSPELEQNNHLVIIGATSFPVIDLEQISINKERSTIEFAAYDGTYLVRPLSDTDVEWAGEENIRDAWNGNF
jgi:hypothetical protein